MDMWMVGLWIANGILILLLLTGLIALWIGRGRSLSETHHFLCDELDRLREETNRREYGFRQEMAQAMEGAARQTAEAVDRQNQMMRGELARVFAGLGEMRKLATDVGNLRQVLSNVKTRGIWGEYQLENLLSDFLTPAQYQAQARLRPGASDAVDFAIRMPGAGGDPVWLPLDAKFPKEDYERLQQAADAGDRGALDAAVKALGDRVKLFAKEISAKYIHPPETTDFALLFLPTEGLYAEVLRIPGLTDLIQRRYRVCVTGPTTLAAVLNSLRMGFQTLALQRRGNDVWKTLSALVEQLDRIDELSARARRKREEMAKVQEDLDRRLRLIRQKIQPESEHE